MPIGAIYLSVDNINPSTLFGGTWEQIKDKFLLCSGDVYNNGSVGGSATMSHTHTVTPAGTNAGTAITAAQMPKHRHTTHLWNNAGTKGNAKTTTNYGAGTTDATAGLYGTWGTWQSSTFQVAQSGLGDQNGITAIAGNGATHTHTFTGTAVTSSAASNTNNMPPYIAVIVWKRIA